MKHVVIDEAASLPTGVDWISAAARRWRTARDAGDPPIVRLHTPGALPRSRVVEGRYARSFDCALSSMRILLAIAREEDNLY